MSLPGTITLELADDDKLYLSDAEIIKKMGLPINRGRIMLRALASQPGFPPKDKLLGDKRYWPAVKLFLDRRHRVTMDASPPNHRGRP